jgi:hypothetical protein
MKEYRNEHGQRHRDGGLPAIEYADGHKEYWVNGEEVTEEEAYRLSPLPVQGPELSILLD